MKPYQTEYEQYMKTVTDMFAKICSYEGSESCLFGEGTRIPVMFYQYKEPLLELDKDFKCSLRSSWVSVDYSYSIFMKERQKIGMECLIKHSKTYEQWVKENKS